MIISSEITGQNYKTVEECLAAEKEFIEKKKAQEEAKLAHQKELDKAYEEAVAACTRYFELAHLDVDINEKDGSVAISGKGIDEDNTFDLLWRLITE